jgi:glycosyltransferase involved in cell wall biosynthesis
MLDDKIKILLVVRWPVGGIRTYLRYVYNNFDPQYYSLTLIAPNVSEMPVLLKDLCKHDIKYIELNKTPSAWDFLKAISHVLKNDKYDIIHSHGLTAGLCSILPSWLYNVPQLLTVHETLTHEQFKGLKGLLKQISILFALPLVTKIHAVSIDARNNLLKYIFTLKFFKQKVVAIRNGIETERFSGSDSRDLRLELNLDENTFLIGFLGRFMPEKGFIYLIDAFEILFTKYKLPSKPVILAFGEGAFIREDKLYVERKGLQHDIFFMQYASNIAPALNGLDLVVMPSLREACALLPMETMVSGIPLIGTDCIGLREILEGTPCKIVPSVNSEALAEAIAEEIRNPSKKIADQFRDEAIRRFDVKEHSAKIIELILSLAEKSS